MRLKARAARALDAMTVSPASIAAAMEGENCTLVLYRAQTRIKEGRNMRRIQCFVVLLVCALAGCRSEKPANEAATERIYQLKGIVVASDATRGEVAIDGEAIPGFMDAMTMSYKLAQPGVASELHTGDHIVARLRVSDTSSMIDQVDVTAQAKPDYKPTKVYNVPAPGQDVPNFKFLNQNGKTITIDQSRGKVLLVTFIYTRCPLPDYCIRMSRNFADIQHQLAAEPGLYDKTHLLSVSFDPAYDTPKVLRSYGSAYSGQKAFSHWDFAAPPASELDAVDQFFDVGVSPGKDSTLTHTLSTAVIAPNGKIFRWYANNDWTPASVIDDIKQAVAQ
jgi:protein SCO1